MKKAAHIERPFIGRPDSANPYVRSALLSEVVSANVIQRIPAQEILSCSGGDTQRKIAPAIVRRSAKECDAKNSEACLLRRIRTRFGMKRHVERKGIRADSCSRPDLRFGHLMSSRALRAAVIAAVFISNAAAAADYELLSTVIVSRHGVRSPIAGTSSLASIAGDPWPSWPVPPGHLTPRGAELARLLGAYYRDYYVAQGLLPAQGCPQPGAVFAWADIDQRTRATAQSLLDGMFPDCGLLADIGNSADQTQRPAASIADGGCAVADPTPPPGLVEHAVFAGEVRHLLFEVADGLVPQSLPILRMDALKPARGRQFAFSRIRASCSVDRKPSGDRCRRSIRKCPRQSPR
jgi:Histidine phosphatase superfamily (branch 2)